MYQNAAIFKVIQVFDQMLLSQKLHDDIPNDSRVIASTNRRTHKQTLLKTIPPCYITTAWVVKSFKHAKKQINVCVNCNSFQQTQCSQLIPVHSSI